MPGQHPPMFLTFLEPSVLHHQGRKNKDSDPPTGELKKTSESHPSPTSSSPHPFPGSLIEFLHLISVFLVRSSLCFLSSLPLNSFPSGSTTCDYASVQTCRTAFNNRGAPLTAVLIKVAGNVLSGAHLAEKALPCITIRDAPGSTYNYTFSASPNHLPFRAKL